MNAKIVGIVGLYLMSLIALAGCSMGLGVNTGLVGPKTDETQIMMDGQISGQDHLADGLYFERIESAFVVGSKEATRAGVGIKGGLRYYPADRFSIYLNGGGAIIPGGGALDKLASSWLYGTIDFGLQYRHLSMGISHISSPFHGAKDGDSGINMLMIRWEF